MSREAVNTLFPDYRNEDLPRLYDSAVELLRHQMELDIPEEIVAWNDGKDRTVADVIKTFRAAAVTEVSIQEYAAEEAANMVIETATKAIDLHAQAIISVQTLLHRTRAVRADLGTDEADVVDVPELQAAMETAYEAGYGTMVNVSRLNAALESRQANSTG